MIRSKKREYIFSLASPVKEKPKEFWRFFKAKTTDSSLPDTLTHNDEQFITAERKADAFNKYFASTFHPATRIYIIISDYFILTSYAIVVQNR